MEPRLSLSSAPRQIRVQNIRLAVQVQFPSLPPVQPQGQPPSPPYSVPVPVCICRSCHLPPPTTDHRPPLPPKNPSSFTPKQPACFSKPLLPLLLPPPPPPPPPPTTTTHYCTPTPSITGATTQTLLLPLLQQPFLNTTTNFHHTSHIGLSIVVDLSFPDIRLLDNTTIHSLIIVSWPYSRLLSTNHPVTFAPRSINIHPVRDIQGSGCNHNDTTSLLQQIHN